MLSHCFAEGDRYGQGLDAATSKRKYIEFFETLDFPSHSQVLSTSFDNNRDLADLDMHSLTTLQMYI